MKTSEFVIILSENRIFGWMLKPYLIEKNNKEYYTITESVLAENNSLQNYSEVQKDLIKLATQCSDKEITKLFSKKKESSRDFIASLSDEKLLLNIREYTEKRLIKSFEILRKTEINVFYKSESKHLFDEDRLELVKGTTKAVFNFSKESNGSKYFLSISDGKTDIKLSEKAGEIISNSPCILMSGQRLYFFSKGDDGIDGKKLMPFFTKDFILIPKSTEKKYFETFVRNSIESFEVRAKGFELKIVDIEPNTILSLENDWHQEFSLILKFNYEINTISLNYPKRSFLEFTIVNDNFHFRKLNRNFDFELKMQNFLQSFKELDEVNQGCFKIKKEYLSELNLLNWLNSNAQILSEKGFTINQNFYNKKYFTKEISIHFKLKENRDWFDLNGTVKFGAYEIPFINLKNHLLNNNPEYVLPNGEIAILPEEWFTKYSELVELGTREGNTLKIKKHHLTFFYKQLAEIDKTLIKKASAINQIKISKPNGLNANFRPYQEIGFNWIYSLYKSRFGSCLADDMGLGKTLQTLATILKISEETFDEPLQIQNLESAKQLSIFEKAAEPKKELIKIGKSAGVIAMPTSLIHNWVNEILKFTPNLKFFIYSGGKRIKSTHEFDDYDLVLTSYGVLRNDIDILKNYQYQFLILDESQYIKNPGSRIYQAVMELKSGYKMVLTGTPIENSLTDLWAQLNFINPGLLGGLEYFRREFADPIEKEKDDTIRQSKQIKLQKLISPFILRRTKQEVLEDLPDLMESIHYCSMSEDQRILYEKEKSRIRNTLLDCIESGDQNEASLIVIQGLTILRQLANHPKLIIPDEDLSSGKFEDIIMMVESLMAENHKVLMFSSFVKHLKLFAGYFDENNISYSMLTGSTQDREKEILKFQGDAERQVFLISLKAGGVGLNLTAADYVFFLDPWWNPAAENQALSRAHRIGQKNKVNVYRFITEDSIEEKILKLQGWKKDLADVFINNNNPFRQLSKEELMDLFK